MIIYNIIKSIYPIQLQPNTTNDSTKFYASLLIVIQLMPSNQSSEIIQNQIINISTEFDSNSQHLNLSQVLDTNNQNDYCGSCVLVARPRRAVPFARWSVLNTAQYGSIQLGARQARNFHCIKIYNLCSCSTVIQMKFN